MTAPTHPHPIKKKLVSGMRRMWPLLVSLGSASVMLLAFLIPSIQDQWDRYQSRRVVQQFAELGDSFMQEEKFGMAQQAYEKAIELSATPRLDIEVKRLEARVEQMSTLTYWGDSVPGDLEEVDFNYLLHLRDKGNVHRSVVLNAYAGFLSSGGRHTQAEAMLAEAIALRPNDALLRINHANVLDDLGRQQEAEAEYKQAITLDPENTSAHYDLGLLYTAMEQWKAAGQELRKAAELAPADTAITNRLAELGDTLVE